MLDFWGGGKRHERGGGWDVWMNEVISSGADDAYMCSLHLKLLVNFRSRSYVRVGRSPGFICEDTDRLANADPKKYLQTLCFDLGVFAQKKQTEKET